MDFSYFRIPFDVYETVRELMDQRSGYPSNHTTTWFTPGISATRCVISGECLIATNETEIVSEFSKYSEVTSLTKEAYEFLNNQN